jgi:hypothetical protein
MIRQNPNHLLGPGPSTTNHHNTEPKPTITHRKSIHLPHTPHQDETNPNPKRRKLSTGKNTPNQNQLTLLDMLPHIHKTMQGPPTNQKNLLNTNTKLTEYYIHRALHADPHWQTSNTPYKYWSFTTNDDNSITLHHPHLNPDLLPTPILHINDKEITTPQNTMTTTHATDIKNLIKEANSLLSKARTPLPINQTIDHVNKYGFTDSDHLNIITNLIQNQGVRKFNGLASPTSIGLKDYNPPRETNKPILQLINTNNCHWVVIKITQNEEPVLYDTLGRSTPNIPREVTI